MHRSDKRRLTLVRYALRRAGIRAMFTADALAVPLPKQRCLFVVHSLGMFEVRELHAAESHAWAVFPVLYEHGGLDNAVAKVAAEIAKQ